MQNEPDRGVKIFRKAGRLIGLFPSLPFPSLFFPPFHPLPFLSLLEVGPLSQGLGSAVSFPSEVPRPKTNLVQYRAVRKPLVAIIYSIVKCM